MILQGDALAVLKTLESNSIDCCVTSPPYWNLRDYGVDGQLGLESDPHEYVCKLVEVFREVRRILKPEGTCWVNLGDSYITSGKPSPQKNLKAAADRYQPRARSRKSNRDVDGAVPRPARSIPDGFKRKDLVGIPWRVALALHEDGWFLRQDVVWSKPAVMPESVEDRCTKSHEYVFLLTKSEDYFFDSAALKEPCVSLDPSHSSYRPNSARIAAEGRKEFSAKHESTARQYSDAGRNRRSVWTIATEPFPDAHFATMPTVLARDCVLAGCPLGGTVIDPFSGAATTGFVALGNGRKFIGIELNPDFVAMSRDRLGLLGFISEKEGGQG